jgi:hypothetical protein
LCWVWTTSCGTDLSGEELRLHEYHSRSPGSNLNLSLHRTNETKDQLRQRANSPYNPPTRPQTGEVKVCNSCRYMLPKKKRTLKRLGWDSVLGTATHYGLDGREIES